MRSQRQRSTDERVIQGRHKLRQLFATNALREQRCAQAAHVVRSTCQGIDIRRLFDRLGDFAQRKPLQCEQIALRNHTNEVPFFHHQYVTESMPRHRVCRFKHRRRRRQREWIRRHHLRNRRILCGARERDAIEHIALGKNADRVLLCVDDYNRTNTQGLHCFEYGANRHAGSHRDRQTAQN